MYSFAFYPSIVVFLATLTTVLVAGNTYGATVRFYNGATVSNYKSYDLLTAESVATDIKFNLTRTTMMFIHGWRQSSSTLESHALLNAYIIDGRYNILALDWSQAAADIIFSTVAGRVNEIGREVALFIGRMNSQSGLSFTNVHLVGHSLGAHMAGSAGNYTVQWSNQTNYIERISGLDPANAYADILNKNYARFVDIIHTDAGVLGTLLYSGHVDFYPNLGTAIQPGCTILPITLKQIACSHFRAVYYWAESVERGNYSSFLAVNRANPDIIISMGNNCPKGYEGIYDLTTNSASWFSKS